jgi:hypothetical protein
MFFLTECTVPFKMVVYCILQKKVPRYGHLTTIFIENEMGEGCSTHEKR